MTKKKCRHPKARISPAFEKYVHDQKKIGARKLIELWRVELVCDDCGTVRELHSPSFSAKDIKTKK